MKQQKVKQRDIYVIRRCGDGKFVQPEYEFNRIYFSDTIHIGTMMDRGKVDYVLGHLINKESRYFGLFIYDGNFIHKEYNRDDFEVLKCKISLKKEK